MNSTFLLRVLLVVAVLLAIAAGALDTAYPEAVPAHAREAFRALLASRDAPRGSTFLALAAVYELLLLAAVIGMIRLRRWGFHLGLAVTAITMVQALLLGPHAYSGIAFMLSYASKVAWGASLALAWTLTRPSERGA
jgi:hypothetical protein